jgi:MFS family permease
MFTTFTPLFRQQYGFGSAIVGLTYLGIGIGCIIGQIYCTWYSNRSYMKHVKAGDAKPEHRLPIMVQGAFLLPIGFFWYGWSADQHAHWIVPIIGTGVIGLGLLLIFVRLSLPPKPLLCSNKY